MEATRSRWSVGSAARRLREAEEKARARCGGSWSEARDSASLQTEWGCSRGKDGEDRAKTIRERSKGRESRTRANGRGVSGRSLPRTDDGKVVGRPLWRCAGESVEQRHGEPRFRPASEEGSRMCSYDGGSVSPARRCLRVRRRGASLRGVQRRGVHVRVRCRRRKKRRRVWMCGSRWRIGTREARRRRAGHAGRGRADGGAVLGAGPPARDRCDEEPVWGQAGRDEMWWSGRCGCGRPEAWTAAVCAQPAQQARRGGWCWECGALVTARRRAAAA
jgi:hypothetical protein